MKESPFIQKYLGHPHLASLTASAASENINTLRLEGLTASSRAVVLATVLSKTQTTHLVILPEKEDAAYFYNDLIALTGEDAVFFFPQLIKGQFSTSRLNLQILYSGRKCLIFLHQAKGKG